MLSLQKRACDTCTHKSSTLRSIKLAAVTPLPLWPAAAPTQRSQRRCSTANALWDSLKLPWARPAEPNPQQVASQALLTALEGSDRGITTSSTARAEIEAAVQALEQLQGSEPTTGVELSATWELLWTTERETLWILKNAGLFGTTAGGVYQVIDVEAGTLQNVIEFPPEGSFVVNSSIRVEGDKRTAFQFTAATLNLPQDKRVNLPPFGKGWFDTVFLSDNLRVARDIRGDVLVCRRAGPPRQF